MVAVASMSSDEFMTALDTIRLLSSKENYDKRCYVLCIVFFVIIYLRQSSQTMGQLDD